MSNLEEFRNKLLEEAKRKAEEIVRGAEGEAKRIVEEAENKWRVGLEGERAKVINEARRRAELILSEARRKARLVLTQTKQELVAEIFNAAYSRVKSREGFDVRKSLEKLLDEALGYVKTPSKVIVNPKDRAIVEELVAKRGLINVVVETSSKIDGGLIVVSTDGEVVDNTYGTRLQRAYENLTPIVVKRIWGKRQ